MPLYPRFQPASQHYLLSLIVSLVEFLHRFYLETVKRILLDTAHDAIAIYHLFSQNKVEPIIDLNTHNTTNTPLDDDFTLSPDGVSIYSKEILMKPSRFDREKDYHKWRCGLAKRNVNTCTSLCSKTKCGRTFLTHRSANPRLITKAKRGSHQ